MKVSLKSCCIGIVSGTGSSIDCEIDLAPQELGLDRERTNTNGGAIALGHPLGATGTRLVLTLLHELSRRGGRYGLATACIGGGQGIAIICERD